MPVRIRCVVPFCTHTRGDRKNDPVTEGMEWLCGEHWLVTPRPWRRRFALFKRRKRYDLAATTWSRLKAAAIERAAGL